MHHQLKITLQDVEPPIWRRVLVPSEMTLFDLHHVIQIAMGWVDYHLHDFTLKKQRYAVPHVEDVDNPADETKARLVDVVGPRSKFTYQYDFGDEWNHVILVEKVVEDDTLAGISCIDGERAGPPEDSGGPWGYQEKLEALFSRARDRHSKELRAWMSPDFDPELFDKDRINKDLTKYRARRARARGKLVGSETGG